MEFDEFERLLGEIPNVTSAKPHSEESGPKMVSLEGSVSPNCVNSCKGPISEKLQNYGNLDDQSLTSAFAGLNFIDGVTVGAGSPLEKSKSLPNHTILFDRQYLNSLKKPNYVDSQMTIASSFKSAKDVPCGFDEFSGTKVGQESSNLLKLNAEETKKRQGDYFQQLENFSATVPFAPAVQGFQFLSNVPVHGVQFPAMPDQQQFFLDAQSLLPYFHPEQINQPQISWRNVEDEQHYRMHQHYQYLQQLRSQGCEAQHAIQAHGNLTARLMSESPRQPYFELPISHQIEKSKQEPVWNNYTNYRGSNQSNSSISFTNFNAMQILDKVTKQKFPETFSTRSHGVNILKDVKFGSVGGNQSLTHVSQNGNFLSNHHLWHSFSTPRAGCFQLDSLRSRGLSHETTDLKSTDLKYNSVDEVTGRIYLMAKDQHGCRFLQKKLAEGTRKDFEKIFLEIVDYIVELMTDSFGNYLVQKLLEICNEAQQMQILRTITRKSGELVRISCDMHGLDSLSLCLVLSLPLYL